MFYSFSIVFTPFHHAINNIYKAIKVNTFLNLLDGTITVKETHGKQIISFIVHDFNFTLMEKSLNGEPYTIFNSNGIVKTPTHYDWKVVPEDAEYIFCHFHSVVILGEGFCTLPCESV